MGWISTIRTTGLAVLASAAAGRPGAGAGQEIKIGVIYDFTGPFAAGGSEAAAIGTQIAIDMVNEQGGVEGHKIAPVVADAQSKAEVAIAEAERLLNQENVDLIMGVYSSAHCVPLAQKVDAAEEVHVGERLRRVGGVQGQEPAVRVPAAGPQRPVRLGVLHLPQGEQRGRSSASRPRTSRSRSSTRTGRTAPASPRATRSIAASTAWRSSSRRATRRPRPISRAW